MDQAVRFSIGGFRLVLVAFDFAVFVIALVVFSCN